jgi:transposase
MFNAVSIGSVCAAIVMQIATIKQTVVPMRFVIRATPKAIREVFGAMPRSRIALETGMHSPWVSRLLSELGQEVIVAHARNVRLIGESRRKTIAWMRRPWRGWRGSIRSCCVR